MFYHPIALIHEDFLNSTIIYSNPCKMKRYLPLIFFLLIAVAFHSCNTIKYVPGTYDKAMLQFGSGGGFTGEYVNYYLLSNGQMFKERSKSGEMTGLVSIAKKEATQLIKEAETAGIKTSGYNKPGNMTWYLTLKEDGKEYRVAWGKPGTEAPVAFKALYDKLFELVKNQK